MNALTLIEQSPLSSCDGFARVASIGTAQPDDSILRPSSRVPPAN